MGITLKYVENSMARDSFDFVIVVIYTSFEENVL